MPIPVVAEPISRVPTRETVAGTLRAWIVDGTLAPEEVLRDADIARAFGISRTPVREALLRLEHEGLVESQPGRWTRVTPLDADQLSSLYFVWAELEALAARAAAIADGHTSCHAAAEDAARAFAATVDAARTDPGEELRRAARAADSRFHDALLDIAANPQLSSALTPLRLRVRRFESVCPDGLRVTDDAVEDHTRILDAVRDGDPDAAATATRAHLRHSYQHLCTGWGLNEAV